MFCLSTGSTFVSLQVIIDDTGYLELLCLPFSLAAVFRCFVA